MNKLDDSIIHDETNKIMDRIDKMTPKKKNNRKMILYSSFSFIVVLVLIFSFSGLFMTKNHSLKMNTINSKSDLITILNKYNDTTNDNLTNYQDSSVIPGAPESQNSSPGKVSSPTDYSNTNTQVSGVDEADLVKTDGNYIYSISQQNVVITSASSIDNLSILKIIKHDNYTPTNLYVDDHYLIIIGRTTNQLSPSSDGPVVSPSIYYMMNPTSIIYIYDKSNFDSPKDIIKISGYVNTSRKTDNQLIIMSNKYIYYNYYKNFNTQNTEKAISLPYYDINGTKYSINYHDLHYVDGTYLNEFVSIFNFNLTDLTKTSHFTFLGSSQTVYVSLNNIYIAQNQYRAMPLMDAVQDRSVSNSTISSGSTALDNTFQTFISKIPYSTDGFGTIKTIKVNGFINNQYSMDEYHHMFRIATSSQTWNNTKGNNIYIFNQDLSLISKIEGIAPGQTIQSVRFVNNRIYLDTFKQVDPFFVIDASNPQQLKVLGELKIPGYCTYLQPYDENHIIGIGFNTTTIDQMTRISGLKISLFNVTNPNNPQEMDSATIPFDSGYSYSDATYNPKALLFSKEKHIIAFPITTTQYKLMKDDNGQSGYQSLYKQSFEVFKIDLTNGIQYQTDITHFTESKQNGYAYGYNIMRGLYIGNVLYTVSQAKIQANRLTDYQVLNDINLPFNNTIYYGTLPSGQPIPVE